MAITHGVSSKKETMVVLRIPNVLTHSSVFIIILHCITTRIFFHTDLITGCVAYTPCHCSREVNFKLTLKKSLKKSPWFFVWKPDCIQVIRSRKRRKYKLGHRLKKKVYLYLKAAWNWVETLNSLTSFEIEPDIESQSEHALRSREIQNSNLCNEIWRSLFDWK